MLNKELLGTLHTFKTVGQLVNFLSDFKADTPLFTDSVEYSGANKVSGLTLKVLKSLATKKTTTFLILMMTEMKQSVCVLLVDIEGNKVTYEQIL